MIKPIKTDREYEQAMSRLDEIFDAKKGSNEGDEFEVLGVLIEKYEDEHFPIDSIPANNYVFPKNTK